MTIGIITLENQTNRDSTIDVVKDWAATVGVHLDIRKLPLGTDGRDLGARLLGTLAPHVLQRSPGRVLVLTNSWVEFEQADVLGTARVRMLERAALAHGVYHVMHDMDACRLAASLLDAHQQNNTAPESAPGSGAWKPHRSVLMVADRPNTAVHGSLKYRLPFVSMNGMGAATWLAEHLEHWDIREDELYWINSEDYAGDRTNPSFVKLLSPKAVVTLGKVAERWCAAAGLKSVQVPHPKLAAHGNFRGHDSYPLGKTLHKILRG